MSPIEIVWYILVFLFGVIGIIRTYPRELGVTTMAVAALLLLIQFGGSGVSMLRNSLSSSAPWIMSNRFAAAVYLGVFLLIIYISYQGITLAFKGTPPRGVLSPMLGFAVGLLNGYFITGTVWFYLHRFGYPFGLVASDRLSASALRVVQYLPPQVFDAQPAYLLGLLILLLILSVWR